MKVFFYILIVAGSLLFNSCICNKDCKAVLVNTSTKMNFLVDSVASRFGKFVQPDDAVKLLSLDTQYVNTIKKQINQPLFLFNKNTWTNYSILFNSLIISHVYPLNNEISLNKARNDFDKMRPKIEKFIRKNRKTQ